MKLATFVIVAITGLARIGDTQATPEKAGAAPGTTPAEQSVARKIDLAHSTLTVRVYKSGLFSMLLERLSKLVLLSSNNC